MTLIGVSAGGPDALAVARELPGRVQRVAVCSSLSPLVTSEVAADVHLWHGVNDPLVPIEHALQLAISLPRCRVFFDPDEGHHFFRRRLARILAVLIGRDSNPGGRVATSLQDGRALARSRGRR